MKNNPTIKEIKMKALPILKDAGVRRAAIFGSYARGEQKKRSDIDILIEPPKNMGLFDLIDLENELKGVLRKKVDLLTFKSIHPLIEDSILEDQVQIV